MAAAFVGIDGDELASDCADGDGRVNHEYTVADDGHLDAAIEFDGLHGGFHDEFFTMQR